MSVGTSQWLSATTVATLFLGAVVPAMVHSGVFAFGLNELGPLGLSWVTLTFLIFLAAAICQAVLAQRINTWPSLFNWFIGIWLAYWLWGLAINSFGYEKPILGTLLSDNTHPVMWGFPLALGLIWWLKPSGIDIRRGVDIALLSVFAVIALRVIFDFLLPESQNIFGWTVGFGWWGLTPESMMQNSLYGVSVRPSFVFVHANTMGAVAAFASVYGLARGQLVGWMIAGMFGFLLIASTSSTSVAAAACGVLVMLVIWARFHASTLLAWGVVTLFAFLLTLGGFWRLSTSSFNLTGRRTLWEIALSSIDLKVGLGTGGEAWVQRTLMRESTVGRELHNSFLSALAWSGLIGFLLLAALFAIACVAGERATRLGVHESLALVVTCLILSMTESTFAYRNWSIGALFLIVATLVSQPATPRRTLDSRVNGGCS